MTTLSLLQPLPALDSQTSPPLPQSGPCPSITKCEALLLPARSAAPPGVSARQDHEAARFLKAAVLSCCARDAAGSIKDWDRSEFLSGWFLAFAKAFLGWFSFSTCAACCGR